jgi:hypothetical protein
VGNWIGLRDWSLLPLSIALAIGGKVPRGATYHAQTSAIAARSRKAIDSVDPTRYFEKYGENARAAVKGYLDEIASTAAAPVVEKYTCVIAAADVFTERTTFQVMQSIRLDLGHGSQVHP